MIKNGSLTFNGVHIKSLSFSIVKDFIVLNALLMAAHSKLAKIDLSMDKIKKCDQHF